jgi:hypothetical protein
MNKKVIDFLLLIFLGFTSYWIALYLVGIFYTKVRPLAAIFGNDYWKPGIIVLVFAVIDFFIVKRLFSVKKED